MRRDPPIYLPGHTAPASSPYVVVDQWGAPKGCVIRVERGKPLPPISSTTTGGMAYVEIHAVPAPHARG